MAYRINNKFPSDLQNGRRAIGVSLPFNGDAVFNSTYLTKDQIKSNLINYFLTNKGERVFNPFFGANLRARIFEQITDGNINLLKKQIEDDIKKFFPFVKIQTIDINKDIDNNSYNIIVNYEIVNHGIKDYINIDIQ